jgi:tetratricopeptide (TPR) repeat protein
MSDAPYIAKATVIAYLGDYPSKQTYMSSLQMLDSPDAQIRRSALIALEVFPPEMRMEKTFKMLNDPVKTVRMEAARQLSTFPLDKIDKKRKERLEKAFEAYEEILRFTADRPESQVSLGIFYSNRKLFEKAEKAYVEALHLQPQFVSAYINYSNFLVSRGRTEEAFDILQKGIKTIPNIAVLHHALGLWYVRNKEPDKAIVELEKATKLAENNARFAYVYAVAIGKKDSKKAINILEKAYLKHNGDLQIVSALAYYYKQRGDLEKSKLYEEKLKALQNFSVP